MQSWKLERKKLKAYRHFDPLMSIEQAEKLANDPLAVATHKFFPFILFENRWTQFARKGKKGKIKTRPIRYAARSDAYIYMRYRAHLSELYENLLKSGPLDDVVLAYRKITDQISGGGKCNIHFAKEAFEYISEQKNCCVIALDISDYFGSIDHLILEAQLCKLTGHKKLPRDLLAVFRNITRYSDVEKLKTYERLGYFGVLPNCPPGKVYRGYLKPKHKIPKQLCEIIDFRQKIAGGNGKPSIIQPNVKGHGIPQGSPISDILANIYLHDFDLKVREGIEKIGGRYTRYSDDILIIVPVAAIKAEELELWVRQSISQFGSKLKIKQTKSVIIEFSQRSSDQSYRVVYDGKSKNELKRFKEDELTKAGCDLQSSEAKIAIDEEYENGRASVNGLEYLGFRYNGKGIYLRDSTFSNLKRKIKLRCRLSARKFVRERPSLTKVQLITLFGPEKKRVLEQFGKVRNFEHGDIQIEGWTFTTYAKRISDVFEPKLNKVERQIKGLKKIIYAEADLALAKALEKL